MKHYALSKPFFDQDEIREITKVVESGWVTQGPRVAQFEQEFADYVGAPHGVCVSNCTTGLHLALWACGVRPGDVVITVSHSYIATANSVRACGAEPYFVDIDTSTLNMDKAHLMSSLERDFVKNSEGQYFLRDKVRFSKNPSPHAYIKDEMKGRLAAILCVHQVGNTCDLVKLRLVADDLRIPLIEDAACALGSRYLDADGVQRHVGCPVGDAVVFSFHPRKLLTAGEGGLIACKSSEVADHLKLLRHHGMAVSDLKRHASKEVVFEHYEEAAFNFRMTDIQAAMLSAQLKKLETMVLDRRKLVEVYDEALKGADAISLLRESGNGFWNYQSLYLSLPAKLDQRHFMQKLLDQGVVTRRGIMCAHLEVPYQDFWQASQLSNSQQARDHGILLPLYYGMTADDVVEISSIIKKSL